MNEISLIDRSFDPNATGPCSISLQANQTGLTYCITDDTQGNYVLFKHHRFDHVYLIGDLITKTAEAFSQEEIFLRPFQTVKFLGYTQQSTLIPDVFFDRHKMQDYLVFNHTGNVDQELFNNYITPLGIHNVFALPRELVSLITMYFKKVEFMNQTTPFLRQIANRKDVFEKPAVYIGLNSGFFDIACIRDGGLKLYNTFQYANENDLLYYVIFACNQVNFDTRQIPLLLSGEISSRLSFYEILKQYIPGTRFDEVTGIPPLAAGLKSLNAPRFLNLLNLQMCASSAEHTKAEK